MRNHISAEHVDRGVWAFQCEGHEPSWYLTVVSSPTDSIQVMKQHVDELHPSAHFIVRRKPTKQTGGSTTHYVGASKS